jgi:ParB/RepB/Spo0J family partition protein
MNIIQIDTSILVEDPTNRKVGGVDIIKSVETLGVLQPILVSQEGDQYKVIAGARRVASAKHYGIPVVPAIVIEKGSVQIQAAENFDRKNLNPIDESDMILALKKDGMTREAIADWMNLSVQQVAKRERLGKLSTKMKNLVKSGQLSASVASEFAMISKDAQDEYLDSYTGKDICSISPAQAKEKARGMAGSASITGHRSSLYSLIQKGRAARPVPGVKAQTTILSSRRPRTRFVMTRNVSIEGSVSM